LNHNANTSPLPTKPGKKSSSAKQPTKKDSREPWYVYMVRCSDETIYTGITNDIGKRVDKHNTGKGAKYTKSRGPVILLASWKYENKSAASKAEHSYKRLSRASKARLIDLTNS